MTNRQQTHIYTWFTGESDILVMTAVMIAIRAVQQAVFITQAVNVGQPDDARLTGELTFRYSSSVIPGQYPSVCDSHRIWFTKEHTKWHQTVRSRHKEKLFTFIYRPQVYPAAKSNLRITWSCIVTGLCSGVLCNGTSRKTLPVYVVSVWYNGNQVVQSCVLLKCVYACVVVDRLYIVLFSTLEETHCTLVCACMYVCVCVHVHVWVNVDCS